MLKLTQELFGNVDPELGRGTGGDDLMATLLDFFEYFQKLIDDRRAHPSDDLVVGDRERRDRRRPDRHPGSGGLLRPHRHRGSRHDELGDRRRSARADRAPRPAPATHGTIRRSCPTAVEEMIRWVSPVKQFMRTATDDSELRGVTIRAGDSVLLSYPSANRDEDVFEPARRVRRRPRPESPRRVRLRGPLLPRHPPRADGSARPLQRAGAAPAVDRARRRARVHRRRSSSAARSTCRSATSSRPLRDR